MIVDAAQPPDADPTRDQLDLELVIVAGGHKGEVVTVTAEQMGRDPLDLLGLPATLTVTAGLPNVVVDR
jgi:hypothetical protein